MLVLPLVLWKWLVKLLDWMWGLWRWKVNLLLVRVGRRLCVFFVNETKVELTGV